MSDANANENQPDISALRAQADRVGGLESDNAAKDREIAFLRAGVDTSTLIGRNIMQMHGDKPLEADAIAETTAAVRNELGLPAEGETPPPVNPAPQPGEEGSPEAALAAAQGALAGGQLPPGSEPIPPEKSVLEMGVDTYTAARRSGVGEIDAQVAGIGEIIRAGAQGHKEAAYDRQAFQAKAAEHGHGADVAGYPERSYEKNVHHTKADALK